MTKYIDIVFDGPPGPCSGRFVEVENDLGESIRIGEWVDRGDGLWALRIPIHEEVVKATMNLDGVKKLELKKDIVIDEVTMQALKKAAEERGITIEEALSQGLHALQAEVQEHPPVSLDLTSLLNLEKEDQEDEERAYQDAQMLYPEDDGGEEV